MGRNFSSAQKRPAPRAPGWRLKRPAVRPSATRFATTRTSEAQYTSLARMTVQTRRFVPGSLTAFPRHWTIAWLVAAALCVSSTAAAQEPAATPEPRLGHVGHAPGHRLARGLRAPRARAVAVDASALEAERAMRPSKWGWGPTRSAQRRWGEGLPQTLLSEASGCGCIGAGSGARRVATATERGMLVSVR